jgi:hypothetical protein
MVGQASRPGERRLEAVTNRYTKTIDTKAGGCDTMHVGDFPGVDRRMKMLKHWDVQYLDALRGGSGLLRMAITDFAEWLQANPGYLVLRVTPV